MRRGHRTRTAPAGDATRSATRSAGPPVPPADGHLPGADRVAELIERRSFLRRTANTLFYGAVATATGTISLTTFLADPALAAGPCCPSCCGPSPCCETSCCGKPCCRPTDDWANGGACRDNNDNCLGKYTGTYSDACWCCPISGTSDHRKCCDCRINNNYNCPNSGNRWCICHKRTNSGCDD